MNVWHIGDTVGMCEFSTCRGVWVYVGARSRGAVRSCGMDMEVLERACEGYSVCGMGGVWGC